MGQVVGSLSRLIPDGLGSSAFARVPTSHPASRGPQEVALERKLEINNDRAEVEGLTSFQATTWNFTLCLKLKGKQRTDGEVS